MEFYEITLNGMYKVLNDCKEEDYAKIVAECIRKWQSRKDVNSMLMEFADNGRFRTFKFRPEDFSSLEQNFWTNQLFGGLVAMMIQLAGLIREGKAVDIDFIRRNFGRPTEVLNGAKCTSCGKLQTSVLDIDKYISLPIIGKRIADGLEKGSLDEAVTVIMSVSAPEIESERNNAKLRCANTSILVSGLKQEICPSCGNRQLKSCKFLKSVKEPVFVPLNR